MEGLFVKKSVRNFLTSLGLEVERGVEGLPICRSIDVVLGVTDWVVGVGEKVVGDEGLSPIFKFTDRGVHT